MSSKRYGLIGGTLSHSFSRDYFIQKFEAGSIDAEYLLFELDDISSIHKLIASNPSLQGLNVTIPYKKAVIPFLSWLSPEAEAIGAVNTIVVDGVKDSLILKGYNTDAPAFASEVRAFTGIHRGKALVLGSGGASAAAVYALNAMGWIVQVVSRGAVAPGSVGYEELTPEVIRHYRLIVNCTPAGMYPDIKEMPPLQVEGITADHYLFDMIYNPGVTHFMAAGLKKGARVMNGSGMLRLQAELSWQLWLAGNAHEKQ